MTTKTPALIDAHGLSGDGLRGRFGTCSACKRSNKVVGPLEVKPEDRRCLTSCDSQRGPRPGKKRY